MTWEFSKAVDVENLAARETPLSMTAGKEGLAALAERIEVPEVLEFKASFTCDKTGPGVCRLEGAIEARLKQQCVRTLEPITTTVKEGFDLVLLAADVADAYLADQDEDGLEDIEIFEGETVDLGEIAAQYLSLMVDRFPVKQGSKVPDAGSDKIKVTDEATERQEKSPFKVLRNLQEKG